MIWSARTGALLDELHGNPWIDDIAWGPDPSTLVTAGEEALGVRVWSVRDGVADEQLTLSSTETETGVGGIALSPDGTRVMAGAFDLDAVKIWDISDAGNAEWANLPSLASFGDVGFLPDGRLAAAGVRGDIRIHDLVSGERSPRIGPPVGEHSFTISPDGTTIAIAYGYTAFPGEVRLWNTGTGDPLVAAKIEAETEGVDWSPDGTLLAVASTALPSTLVMDRSGAVVAELPDQGPYATVAPRFSPDGRLIATIGGDDRGHSLIAIWDWRRRQLLRTMPTDPAQGLAFDPSGDRLVTMLGPPVIWDVHSGTRIGTLDVYPSRVGTAAFGPDGRRIAASAGTAGVTIFDADTGSELLTLRSPDLRWPTRLAFSADGSMLASQAASTLGGPGIVRVLALDIDDLIDIARQEVTRPLSAQECLRYWHLDDCST
jgi:WD40 repeat protein